MSLTFSLNVYSIYFLFLFASLVRAESSSAFGALFEPAKLEPPIISANDGLLPTLDNPPELFFFDFAIESLKDGFIGTTGALTVLVKELTMLGDSGSRLTDYILRKSPLDFFECLLTIKPGAS